MQAALFEVATENARKETRRQRALRLKRECSHPTMQVVRGDRGDVVALFCPRCRGRFSVKPCLVCTRGIRRSLEGANPIGRPRLLCDHLCQRERAKRLAEKRKGR